MLGREVRPRRPQESGASARREAIRRLLAQNEVDSQETLRALLREAGFEVTQATLSRDLAQLGAHRMSAPDGGSRYALSGPSQLLTDDRLWAVGQMVVSASENGQLVVVHTLPGAASAVAQAIDAAHPQEVLGTIAGDDTIFVAPTRGTATRKLQRRLWALFGKDGG